MQVWFALPLGNLGVVNMVLALLNPFQTEAHIIYFVLFVRAVTAAPPIQAYTFTLGLNVKI